MPNENQPRDSSEPNPAVRSTGPPLVPPSGGFPWKTVLILIIVAVGIGLLLAKRKAQSATQKGGAGRAAAGPVPVIVGTVARKDVPIYLDGLGTVQAFNTVTISSRVDGQLQKLSFREGQDVHAGDLLAQIDPEPFRTQVAQLEAKKAQDEAQLSFAQLELKRDADLLATKIVSQEAYDTQKAQVNQLEAAVNADQAAIDNARVQLNYTRITAPIDGRIGIRLVDEGNMIRGGTSNGIVVLTQLRPISLVFTLPEQSFPDIQKQLSLGEMTVLAMDRDNTNALDEGKLTVVDNEIDTATGTIRLKATFPNPDLRLWPGQFVNARLLLTIRKGGMVVPASVIQRGPEGSYAFVVNDDMTVKMSPVQVAQIDQGQALLDSGLTPGERVVVDGQYKLQPGSKIKPAEPAPTGSRGSNATAHVQHPTNAPGQSHKESKSDGPGM